ncbi:hypothetical protein H8959_019674 [Pygathrix nigripes]
MLVMEQFMISMPQELQVLVMMNGVQSCKDLEDLLRNNRRPKKWSVVNLLGKEYLMQDSDVEMAEAPTSARDDPERRVQPVGLLCEKDASRGRPGPPRTADPAQGPCTVQEAGRGLPAARDHCHER